MKNLQQLVDEWSYEEYQFVIEKMKLRNFYYRWTKIARHLNKNIHEGEIVKTDKQIKRRWLYVLKPLLAQEWNRNQAMIFVKISQKYYHSSRRYWIKLKKELKPYSYKMLKSKYKQYQLMGVSKFIISHKTVEMKKEVVPGVVDCVSMLCKQLGSLV